LGPAKLHPLPARETRQLLFQPPKSGSRGQIGRSAYHVPPLVTGSRSQGGYPPRPRTPAEIQTLPGTILPRLPVFLGVQGHSGVVGWTVRVIPPCVCGPSSHERSPGSCKGKCLLLGAYSHGTAIGRAQAQFASPRFTFERIGKRTSIRAYYCLAGLTHCW